MGARALCSSRDGGAFAYGLSAQQQSVRGRRLHAVLNSLSLDFIAASFAALGERGAFAEIGKRAIWAPPRQAAAAAHAAYGAIAIDTDWAEGPAWMHGLLCTLARRADAGALSPLPLRSFDLESQAELAFRTLQSGQNTGKIVVRVAGRVARALSGAHVVTGGTGGLGLLTARWLAESGASRLALVSRSGRRSSASAHEWAGLVATGAQTVLMSCDSGDVSDVQRLAARTRDELRGVWHAAGVLADSVLASQSADALRHVYAPKAHGAWALQRATAAAPLRVSLYFSSMAALLGNPGQANYSSANACLDAIAACRRAHGVAASSVQWGPWGDVGMAAAGVAASRLAASGFELISAAHGLAAMQAAARDGSSAVLGVVPLVWSRYLGGGGSSVVPSFLEAFAPRGGGAFGGKEGSAAAATDAHSGGGGGGVSLEAVLEMARRTAGGEVDSDAPFMEAGVDSLGAVELRNQLQRAAGSGLALPSTIVFDHPTARSLASFLAPRTADEPPEQLGRHVAFRRRMPSTRPMCSDSAARCPQEQKPTARPGKSLPPGARPGPGASCAVDRLRLARRRRAHGGT